MQKEDVHAAMRRRRTRTPSSSTECTVAWVAARGAGIVATERVPAVVVATKLAGARVLDKSERQVLVVVEGIQDLVVCVTKGALIRSLEGSHEDGHQNVFNGEGL